MIVGMYYTDEFWHVVEVVYMLDYDIDYDGGVVIVFV